MSQAQKERRNRGGLGEPRLFIATWIVQGNQRSRATVGVDVGASAWAWLGPVTGATWEVGGGGRMQAGGIPAAGRPPILVVR